MSRRRNRPAGDGVGRRPALDARGWGLVGAFPGPVLGIVAAATCFAACEEAIELVDDLATEGAADAGDGTDDDDDDAMRDGGDAMRDGGDAPACLPPGALCQPDVDPSQCCQDVGDDGDRDGGADGDDDDDPDDDDGDDDDAVRVVCRPTGGVPPELRCTPVP